MSLRDALEWARTVTQAEWDERKALAALAASAAREHSASMLLQVTEGSA